MCALSSLRWLALRLLLWRTPLYLPHLPPDRHQADEVFDVAPDMDLFGAEFQKLLAPQHNPDGDFQGEGGRTAGQHVRVCGGERVYAKSESILLGSHPKAYLHAHAAF